MAGRSERGLGVAAVILLGCVVPLLASTGSNTVIGAGMLVAAAVLVTYCVSMWLLGASLDHIRPHDPTSPLLAPIDAREEFPSDEWNAAAEELGLHEVDSGDPRLEGEFGSYRVAVWTVRGAKDAQGGYPVRGKVQAPWDARSPVKQFRAFPPEYVASSADRHRIVCDRGTTLEGQSLLMLAFIDEEELEWIDRAVSRYDCYGGPSAIRGYDKQHPLQAREIVEFIETLIDVLEILRPDTSLERGKLLFGSPSARKKAATSLINHANPAVRLVACRHAAQDTDEILQALLAHETTVIRFEAVRQLLSIKSPAEIFRMLQSYAADLDPLHCVKLVSMAQADTEAAESFLIELTSHSDEMLRIAACKRLGEVGGTAAAQRLAEILDSEVARKDLRQAAQSAATKLRSRLSSEHGHLSLSGGDHDRGALSIRQQQGQLQLRERHEEDEQTARRQSG